MGYAMPQQTAHGIHFRQWSRAFIIADSQNKTRVVFVNVDVCMGTQLMKMQVSTHCIVLSFWGYKFSPIVIFEDFIAIKFLNIFSQTVESLRI